MKSQTLHLCAKCLEKDENKDQNIFAIIRSRSWFYFKWKTGWKQLLQILYPQKRNYTLAHIQTRFTFSRIKKQLPKNWQNFFQRFRKKCCIEMQGDVKERREKEWDISEQLIKWKDKIFFIPFSKQLPSDVNRNNSTSLYWTSIR